MSFKKSLNSLFFILEAQTVSKDGSSFWVRKAMAP